MAAEQILLCALLLWRFQVCSSNGDAGADLQMVPSLQMSTSFRNVSAQMTSNSVYYYSFTIEHTLSSAMDAKGVHVTWMMTPFVQFKAVTSVQPSHIGSNPQVVFKDDSWVFKIGELVWGMQITVEFSVVFDPEITVRPGKHHLVTPVHLKYYNKYNEDQDGNVVDKGSFFATPLSVVEFDFEVPGCSAALGMKTGHIKTYQITASSSYPETQPSQAREGDDAWCAKVTNDQQYIQVDFQWKTRITGLCTFRRQAKKHRVTKYILLYSNDDVTWHEYNENGFVKEFEGNSISYDPVFYWLRHPIESNSLRIHPVDWEGLICLRFEVFGCVIEGSPSNCISPLGLESGEIRDEALSDSLPDMSPAKPPNIRLYRRIPQYPFGWQARPGIGDWLQVDFGSLRRLTRIAVMGGYTDRPNTYFFITTYKLKYSNNSLDWMLYEHDGNKNLKGPKDGYEAKYPVLAKLTKPVIARYIRFIPNDGGSSSKVLRAEVYGCNAEQLPPYGDVPEYNRRSYLLDPVTDLFFVCMYTADRMKSSCFSTKDGKEWEALEPFIISIIALFPKDLELYALDRAMNFYRSQDSGKTWVQVDERRFRQQQTNATILASGIPESVVSSLPLANYTAVASSGLTWGVSAAGIHIKSADSDSWTTVGSWKCCGN